MSKPDEPTVVQLEDYKAKNKPNLMTTSYGAPIADKTNVLTVGPRGPMLMQDAVYINEMAHFDRERIPERVVHAKGGGLFLSDYAALVTKQIPTLQMP
ncbi:unnamed protein product [Haemonchus placei]|uniref:Catalase domain-containing protein n=1 Tax=Haemonchus placei TaxID=6290 RepID=A0A0N4VZF9_HAEPC|nr:unnamed protein product [Haemonchus placei]